MPFIKPYIKRIPKDVLPKAAGLKLEIPAGPEFIRHQITPSAQAIRVSLRTYDPKEWTLRAAKADTYLSGVWAALRRGHMIPLHHEQAVRLARDIYAGWAAEQNERTNGVDLDRPATNGVLDLTATKWMPLEPGVEVGPNPDLWESVVAHLDDPKADPEAVVGAVVTARLLKRGIAGTDADTRAMVVREFYNALRDAVTLRQRQAAGDYSPDPKEGRFAGGWEDPMQPTASSSDVTITGLVEDWWLEAKRAGRSIATYEAYKRIAKGFSEFLKHDDAARVTEANVMAYRDARLAEGRDPKTVRDGDLAGLKSIFRWAVDNRKLTANPAVNVKMMRFTKPKLRNKSFMGEEALAILALASASKGASRLDHARRWVPWLCAYTGARVGEMAQLRKQDVQQEDGVWYLLVTPEAGTVKTKEARKVALHQHLIDMGFLDFVSAAKKPYLFIDPTNDLRRAIRLVSQKLGRVARTVVTDEGVSPNHGWRHTFKTVGRSAGMSDTVLDAMCGHAPDTEGGRYGEVPVVAQRKALELFPRFNVDLS